jgi:hypothetical protein
MSNDQLFRINGIRTARLDMHDIGARMLNLLDQDYNDYKQSPAVPSATFTVFTGIIPPNGRVIDTGPVEITNETRERTIGHTIVCLIQYLGTLVPDSVLYQRCVESITTVESIHHVSDSKVNEFLDMLRQVYEPDKTGRSTGNFNFAAITVKKTAPFQWFLDAAKDLPRSHKSGQRRLGSGSGTRTDLLPGTIVSAPFTSRTNAWPRTTSVDNLLPSRSEFPPIQTETKSHSRTTNPPNPIVARATNGHDSNGSNPRALVNASSFDASMDEGIRSFEDGLVAQSRPVQFQSGQFSQGQQGSGQSQAGQCSHGQQGSGQSQAGQFYPVQYQAGQYSQGQSGPGQGQPDQYQAGQYSQGQSGPGQGQSDQYQAGQYSQGQPEQFWPAVTRFQPHYQQQHAVPRAQARSVSARLCLGGTEYNLRFTIQQVPNTDCIQTQVNITDKAGHSCYDAMLQM